MLPTGHGGGKIVLILPGILRVSMLWKAKLLIPEGIIKSILSLKTYPLKLLFITFQLTLMTFKVLCAELLRYEDAFDLENVWVVRYFSFVRMCDWRNGHSAVVLGISLQCHLWELRLSPNQNFLTLKTLSFKFFLTWMHNKFLDSFEILGLWNWNCLTSWSFYLMHLKELCMESQSVERRDDESL